jgi:hypothetical protein
MQCVDASLQQQKPEKDLDGKLKSPQPNDSAFIALLILFSPFILVLSH